MLTDIINKGLALSALALVVLILAMAYLFGQHLQQQRLADAYTVDAVTDAPRTPQREAAGSLRCQEDEDIVITLGDDGLPYAFCEQVIER